MKIPLKHAYNLKNVNVLSEIDIVKKSWYHKYIIEKSKLSESLGRKATILKEIPMDVELPMIKNEIKTSFGNLKEVFLYS